jgi:hypothetical protein
MFRPCLPKSGAKRRARVKQGSRRWFACAGLGVARERAVITPWRRREGRGDSGHINHVDNMVRAQTASTQGEEASSRGGTRHACGSGEHTRPTDSVHTGTRRTMARGWRAFRDSEHEAVHAMARVRLTMARWRAASARRRRGPALVERGMRAHTASVRRWRARETGAGAAHVVLSARWCRSKLRLGQLLDIR